MRFRGDRPAEWILRPSVATTMAYGGVVAVWFQSIWRMTRGPWIFDESIWRVIDTPLFLAFSGANAGLGLWLLADLRPALCAPHGLRRGQVAGVALAFLFVATLQYGARGLHYPRPNESGLDPAKIEAYLDRPLAEDAELVRFVRAEILERVPRALEAYDHADDGSLVYACDELWVATLSAEEGETTLAVPAYDLAGLRADEETWELVGRDERRCTPTRLVVASGRGLGDAEGTRALLRIVLRRW